jgi:hypothetical protein
LLPSPLLVARVHTKAEVDLVGRSAEAIAEDAAGEDILSGLTLEADAMKGPKKTVFTPQVSRSSAYTLSMRLEEV